MKNMHQHLDALRYIAELAGKSSDLDMRSKAATLNWLAKEFEEALRTQLPPLQDPNLRTLCASTP